MNFKRIFLCLLAISLTLGSFAGKKHLIKILAIGNSFSVDAVEQNLYELARNEGDSLVIGNAYIGGCSIETHWNNAKENKGAYSYRKVVGGVKTTYKKRSIKQMVQDEPWDIITIQQASGEAGFPNTYGHFSDLKKYVEKHARKPFHWAYHMTWAFQQDCKRPNFVNYGWSQLKMSQAILKTNPEQAHKVGITDIIPSIVAVQKLRELAGDTITRDGFHMDYGIGRYTVACLWCEWLTGKNVERNPFKSHLISWNEAKVAQKAAHEAMIWFKKKPAKPKAIVNEEYYDFVPHISHPQTLIKKHGITIITTKTPLPDSVRLKALPAWKVKRPK